ncbi:MULTISPECIES: hypothetical protein [unclassified Meridianimarinicoccus]|uniref:hypothetical protein n=1 Tax=unclassified Meridianimarinicoccus TaxID=2923344 RepID=UPI001866F9B3|nr:hypothetical protein [Fluviibacterium sp. MJW13]
MADTFIFRPLNTVGNDLAKIPDIAGESQLDVTAVWGTNGVARTAPVADPVDIDAVWGSDGASILGGPGHGFEDPSFG